MKNIIKHLLAFVITAVVLVGVLLLTALIPQSAIKENVKSSAEYLCQSEVFEREIDTVKSSNIDRYADSILLSIAYQYDSENPLYSVMTSSYYYSPYKNENYNLLNSVKNGLDANQQYLRYWHGSIAVVRPLLTVFSINQIYIFNAVVLIILALLLIALLIKYKANILAIAFIVGIVFTGSWFVPFSLEYTWTFMIMLVMSIIMVLLCNKGKWESMGMLLLVCGMITSYMDFLTTELITLFVPLLIALWFNMRENQENSKSSVIKTAVRYTLLWGIGYIGMWALKWLLAGVVMQENIIPYLSEHISERLGGDVGIGLFKYLWGAIANNVSSLFVFDYGMTGIVVGLIAVVFTAYILFVYRKKEIDITRILLYLCIGVIPYIRYLVLHNHSYLHYFFTYRTQIITVISIVLIIGELSEWRWRIRQAK